MLPSCLSPLKQHIIRVRLLALLSLIRGRAVYFSYDSPDAAIWWKHRVPDATCYICEPALMHGKQRHARTQKISTYHFISTQRTHTDTPATCTDKNKCGRKDRNWAGEKVRYHYLARTHRTDRLIQTELLSAQLKLRESDRPANVSENNIAQTHWVDRLKDSQHSNETVSGPAHSQMNSVNLTTSQRDKMWGLFRFADQDYSSDIKVGPANKVIAQGVWLLSF